MVVVADINTLWRCRPFRALANVRPVLALAPADPCVAFKQRRLPWGTSRSVETNLSVLSVVLPFGWATRRAAQALPKLWLAACRQCRARGSEPSSLVVTSPHYAPLVEAVGGEVPVFYYCSDDYSNYEGWDANQMLEQEASIVRRARHSFFVSNALRERAVRRYDVSAAVTSVSMNATDSENCSASGKDEAAALRQRFPQIKNPVAGVIGGINDRLDYSLLLAVAELPALGTLLLVGPTGQKEHPELTALLRHPRVVAVGPQPHKSLPAWQQLLDVALIPYRDSEFNRCCSPMRLFDHLAMGRRVVSTRTCQQICEFEEWVRIATSEKEFLKGVSESLTGTENCLSSRQREFARQHTWDARAANLDAVLGRQTEPSPT